MVSDLGEILDIHAVLLITEVDNQPVLTVICHSDAEGLRTLVLALDVVHGYVHLR